MAYEEAVRLYPHLYVYPLLREILDTFVFPKLKERLAFGQPTDGTLFTEEP
jgi:hypothetical protein